MAVYRSIIISVYLHIQVERICKVISYAKSLLPGSPCLQEESALIEVSNNDRHHACDFFMQLHSGTFQ